MVLVNVSKYFKDSRLSDKLGGWLETLTISHGGKSSGDGQLAPSNWVRDDKGKLWKLNTTGSKLSHFIPYRLPILWDVAQASVEWEFSPVDEARFCAVLAAGNLRFGREELEFFKLCVAAFELGKCVLLGVGNESRYESLIRALAQAWLSP